MTNFSSEPPRGDQRRPGEFELIAKYFAPLAEGVQGALGLTDDAAFLRVPNGQELVATVDTLVEGRHFFRDDPPETIGAKSLRVNLSDLAAKGAVPSGYLLALSLPPWVDEPWIARFAAGLSDNQFHYAIGLLGGDTTATPGPLTISITAFGHVVAGEAMHRSGARPGDLVFVSGTIGDAGAGLELLNNAQTAPSQDVKDGLVARYRLPEPRVGPGRLLAGVATAALDVSDGLIADLGHIAEVSGVRIIVEGQCIPLSPHYLAIYGRDVPAQVRAATAGDDYEIAFTAPPEARGALRLISGETGVPLTEIGRVEEGLGIVLQDAHGAAVPLIRSGYQHF